MSPFSEAWFSVDYTSNPLVISEDVDEVLPTSRKRNLSARLEGRRAVAPLPARAAARMEVEAPHDGRPKVFECQEGESEDEEASIKASEVFQSITCTPGLREKSFEELRVECYFQTTIATGRHPLPVDPQHPRNAIPPAYIPFKSAYETGGTDERPKVVGGGPDVLMSLEPTLACEFTFSMTVKC
ncbi:hypothetical protein JAAARDRAFT_48259 [Jaapia argillacea MUCL 33604]|uniref:Uncharacterized protein n=1 Tax=Jaapia argillacea MUCL 33604 TaxID=933084 RepID=A0A067PYJ2_9AGAM|nr:hypothetical protein JAAARDRAFT_48259 [Jaapia argillacea MUCL 33604]